LTNGLNVGVQFDEIEQTFCKILPM